jgi:hypothetical protein
VQEGAEGHYFIDYENSKIVPYLQPQYLWVNLAGREEGGVVDPADYEAVRDEVIDVLLSLRDPETGRSPMELVCRREALGHANSNTSTVGDVLFFLKPPYTNWDGFIDTMSLGPVGRRRIEGPHFSESQLVLGNHTPYLPTARYNGFANGAMTFFSGPGIREGIRRPEPIRLTDIAPTAAKVLGIAPPRDAQGRVLSDVLS